MSDRFDKGGQITHVYHPNEVHVETWLGDDPDLALVHADMDAWREAHPCECEALCECEEGEG